MMRRTIIFIIILFIIGCAEKKQTGKLTVIATLFPQYDFAKQVAKDKADVRLLLPPGVESHTYEPTPKDIADINKSDVFIFTGEYMEPWSAKLRELIKNKTIIVDASAGIVLLEESEEGHKAKDIKDNKENSIEHNHHGKDPHVWVDPVNAQKMTDNIAAGLARADQSNEGYYKANAAAYKKELMKLHQDFSDVFEKTKYKTIIHGGHFTFGYFAKRYGLTYFSPYKGFSPDAEPTPRKIAALIKLIKSTGQNTIYYEELIDPKVARVISDQTGASMLLLHGAHNVSKKDIDTGTSFISIMRENMERLKTGLGYKK
jgi:zinc transport system substrate-binding protein